MKKLLYSTPMTRIKRLIGKLLLTDTMGNMLRRYYGDTIPFRGTNISIKHKEIKGKIVAHLFFKSYEGAEVRFVNKYLKPELPVIELGGSLGVVSLQICKKSRSVVNIVEVNPKLVPIIQQNLSSNEVSNFQILNEAISYSNDRVYFVEGSNNTTGLVTNQKEPNAIEVRSTSLGDLVQRFGLESYILVCDIEGMEIDILLHDKKALAKCRQLIIETHATTRNNIRYGTEEMKELILTMGFKEIEAHGANFVFER